MSDDCFSVLAILILHRFDLALHAHSMILLPYSMLFCNNIKKKIYIYIYILGEYAWNSILFFLACQMLLVFLPDISVHCALINFA
jgi:hypothetical protein